MIAVHTRGLRPPASSTTGAFAVVTVAADNAPFAVRALHA